MLLASLLIHTSQKHMPIKTAIHGAAGRMGQRLIALGAADDEIELVAALEYAQHPKLGQDAGVLAGVEALDLPLTADLVCTEAEAIVDFSIPDSCAAMVALAAERKIPLVVATTGLSETQQANVTAASDQIPIVWAPSMSLAVNLTMKLAEQAASALKDLPGGADVEIIERHHRYKEDAPSGTALRFGEIVAQAMQLTRHQHGREGMIGARPHEEIGYHALRTGDNTGEHTIVFGMLGETIELSVKSSNRDCYALGALAAAKFVARQGPGLYNMYDVLGL